MPTMFKSFMHERTTMLAGDNRDHEIMVTIENNNDKLCHGKNAMLRHAFIGMDHPIWGSDPEQRDAPLCEHSFNG